MDVKLENENDILQLQYVPPPPLSSSFTFSPTSIYVPPSPSPPPVHSLPPRYMFLLPPLLLLYILSHLDICSSSLSSSCTFSHSAHSAGWQSADSRRPVVSADSWPGSSSTAD
eukprot:7031940-Pyramimonas_sp.AAC.1